MHRDTVIGIVGVVILVAAMVGVFTFEKGQAAGLTAVRDLALENATLSAVDGTVAVGATETILVNVTPTNVTRVVFTITWTSGAQAADTVNVTIAPPGDLQGGSAEAASGSVTVTIDVPNDRPTSAPIAIGTGEWEVKVQHVGRTTGGAVQQGVPVIGADPLPISIATTVTSWQPATA